jgi:hypothetical protein
MQKRSVINKQKIERYTQYPFYCVSRARQNLRCGTADARFYATKSAVLGDR